MFRRRHRRPDESDCESRWPVHDEEVFLRDHQLFDFIPFGGDYNPDQWPAKVLRDDLRMLKAAGVNFLTLPVFSWAKLQPSEDVYRFEWLDATLDTIADAGMKVCLATPTAAQPAWMSRRYPDILPVDVQGRRRTHGKRINFCPNSRSYRRFAAAIASRMGERYARHPVLAMWHVSNEYGTHCYCDECADAFRLWLEHRYRTVDELNDRWYLSFWGHTVYDWDEVTVPSALNDDDTCNPPKALDYQRFMTDSIVACYRNELDAIRVHSPDVPATTNYTGFIRKLDFAKLAEHVDVIGWDNYPAPSEDSGTIALKHDLMRGLKGGQPFFLMEQSPNQQNWQPYNELKRPGAVRRLSYQALGHGADSVLFFQMRAGRGGVEKLHGAFIDHSGGTDTRVFREMSRLGAELQRIGDRFAGARTDARVAMLFDWDNWWAVELSSGPNRDLDFFDLVNRIYLPFFRRNVAVDLVRSTSRLDPYDLVVAPAPYLMRAEAAERIDDFVRSGGTFVTTYLAGLVDETDLVAPDGAPGLLRATLGIRSEEIDALPPAKRNRIVMKRSFDGTDGTADGDEGYECGLLCDLIRLDGAEALAVFGDDFYAGRPALTLHRRGKGTAYYLATDPEERFLTDLADALCAVHGIAAPFGASPDVEIAVRAAEGLRYAFVINHSPGPGWIDLGPSSHLDLITGGELSGRQCLEPSAVLVLESEAP